MVLLACKKCKNVFTDMIGGVRSIATKCPVCQSTDGEQVYFD